MQLKHGIPADSFLTNPNQFFSAEEVALPA